MKKSITVEVLENTFQLESYYDILEHGVCEFGVDVYNSSQRYLGQIPYVEIPDEDASEEELENFFNTAEEHIKEFYL